MNLSYPKLRIKILTILLVLLRCPLLPLLQHPLQVALVFPPAQGSINHHYLSQQVRKAHSSLELSFHQNRWKMKQLCWWWSWSIVAWSNPTGTKYPRDQNCSLQCSESIPTLLLQTAVFKNPALPNYSGFKGSGKTKQQDKSCTVNVHGFASTLQVLWLVLGSTYRPVLTATSKSELSF